MSYNVKVIPRFEKDLKRLVKKYPSLKLEFFQLIKELSEFTNQGVALGNNCFKIRLSIASKGKGKSGGARIIIHIQIEEKNLFLLTIYDKSEKENITNKELQELLQYIP